MQRFNDDIMSITRGESQIIEIGHVEIGTTRESYQDEDIHEKLSSFYVSFPLSAVNVSDCSRRVCLRVHQKHEHKCSFSIAEISGEWRSHRLLECVQSAVLAASTSCSPPLLAMWHSFYTYETSFGQ